jgi:hypothetical protein
VFRISNSEPPTSEVLPLDPTFSVLVDIISFSLCMSLIYNYGSFKACRIKRENLIFTVVKQWGIICSIFIWCQLVLLNFYRFYICFSRFSFLAVAGTGLI